MFGLRRKSVREKIERDGVRAWAEILEISERGWAITTNNDVAGSKVAVRVLLQVRPTNGIAAFEVRPKLRFPRFDMPKVGQQLAVIFLAEDHEQIILDPAPPAPQRVSQPQPEVEEIHVDLGMGAGFDLTQLVQQVRDAKDAAGGDPALLEQLLRDRLGGAVVVHDSGDFGSTGDPLDRLAKLAALRDQGVLTQAEFDQQKAKILGEM